MINKNSSTSKLKKSLEAKLDELVKRAAEIESELSDRSDSDWSENAIGVENDETLQGVENITQQEIREVKLALHRIESGTYGTCSDCGKKISESRLEAIPFCNTCIDCA